MRWKVLMYLLKVKSIDEELRDIIDYMIEEIQTLRSYLPSKLRLNNMERIRLSKLANKISRKSFESVCTIFKPDTVLRWYKKILAQAHTYDNAPKMGRPRLILK